MSLAAMGALGSIVRTAAVLFVAWPSRLTLVAALPLALVVCPICQIKALFQLRNA